AATLTDAVRRVAAGEGVVAPEVTRRLLAEFARAPEHTEPEVPADVAALTEREREVLAGLGQGLSNAGLAEAPGITEATARTHVSRVLARLGCTSRVRAAIRAREAGLAWPAPSGPVCPNERGVPVGAGLGGPLQRRVVDVDDAEPLGVAVAPLEVVEQRPQVVPAHGRPGLDGVPDGAHVRAQVGDAVVVLDGAVGSDDVGESGPVLGDDERGAGVLAVHPHEELAEPARVHRPSHVGVRAGLLRELDVLARGPRAHRAVAVAVGLLPLPHAVEGAH